MDLLPEKLQGIEFVNADTIASGLTGSQPEEIALKAGRIMLSRIRELAESQEDFAFESTLAARSFAPFLQAQRRRGYGVRLIYLWLPSVDMAAQRVRARVAAGGHDIPPDVIVRRYTRGLINLFELYMPLSTSWSGYTTTLGRPP